LKNLIFAKHYIAYQITLSAGYIFTDRHRPAGLPSNSLFLYIQYATSSGFMQHSSPAQLLLSSCFSRR